MWKYTRIYSYKYYFHNFQKRFRTTVYLNTSEHRIIEKKLNSNMKKPNYLLSGLRKQSYKMILFKVMSQYHKYILIRWIISIVQHKFTRCVGRMRKNLKKPRNTRLIATATSLSWNNWQVFCTTIESKVTFDRSKFNFPAFGNNI